MGLSGDKHEVEGVAAPTLSLKHCNQGTIQSNSHISGSKMKALFKATQPSYHLGEDP